MEVKEAFKFCPRCSARFNKTAHHLKCPSCGLSYYLNPKPVQSVILENEQNEILFVVRSIEPRKGYLDFPGGFVDEDEGIDESARREIKEELGIDVGSLKYLSDHTDDYPFEEISYRTIGITYIGKLPAGAILKPADDVSGVEFYKLESVPIDRLAWPSMHEMLANLKTKAS